MSTPWGIANEVRALRNRQGLRLREVARRTGVSAAHIHDIETGSRNPSRELAIRIADALSTPLPLPLKAAPEGYVLVKQEDMERLSLDADAIVTGLDLGAARSQLRGQALELVCRITALQRSSQ